MQQTKRRSKRGVILLAVVVAMLVMAIVPAVAMAAETVQVNDGSPYANDTTVKLTYKSDNVLVSFVTFQDRRSDDNGVTWTVWTTESSPVTAYAGGTTGNTNYKLRSTPFNTGDKIQVRAWFYISTLNWLPYVDSQVVTLNFNGPPVSLLEFDSASFFHPGRGGIEWTNGDGHAGEVWATFNQEWSAPMGTTHWIMTKNSDAAIVEPVITWSPWGTADPGPENTVLLVKKANPHALINPQPEYSTDGQYSIQHWAVDMFQQRQVTDSYDTFGFDTKAPYVVWSWPATTTGYYNSATIAVSGDVIDDGGSGVAGYFPIADQMEHFTPEAHVYWKSADTGYKWALWEGIASGISGSGFNQKALTVQINAFDHYRWHISGSIYVKPYYNAEYAVFVTGSDYAGNDGFPWEDWGIGEPPVAPAAAKGVSATENIIGMGVPGKGVVVDNMAPSTIIGDSTPMDPNAHVNTGPGNPAWTNKDVTVNFVASDAGGSGIASGVAYTEYVVGNSATTPPLISASGTKGTTVTIKDTAPVGPVYLWFRSVDNAGNKEAWNLAWVWIDNKAPVLSIAGNGPWYNEDFWVILSATDNNSHLATPGIEYQVPGWTMPFLLPHSGTLIPTVWTPLSQNPGEVDFPVDPYPNSRTDGIWPLNFRATDQAKNTTVDTTATVKIDTRPPATAGFPSFGPEMWVNGTIPYVLSATDQAPGAGVAVTWYRTDQSTPWTASSNATTSTVFNTNVNLGPATQGAVHTVDFFSIDKATNPAGIAAAALAVTSGKPNTIPYPGNWEKGVVVGWAPIPLHPYINITSVTGYKSTTVKLDVTAPVVTAIDPKNGNWQKPLATVNFAGTDVGSGYNHTEWSTDGGTNWTTGSQAQVGGDGVITITYRGVDNVGIKSANQTIEVKVASTPPTVTAQNASTRAGKRWKNPTITFNITAVTPSATAVIQIRTLDGKTLSTHHYANVATGSDVSKTFTLNTPLKAGKYNIRVGAVDMAGNVQTKRGSATLTVTK